MLFGVIWVDGITPKLVLREFFTANKFSAESEKEATTFKRTMESRFPECKYEVVVLEDH